MLFIGTDMIKNKEEILELIDTTGSKVFDDVKMSWYETPYDQRRTYDMKLRDINGTEIISSNFSGKLWNTYLKERFDRWVNNSDLNFLEHAEIVCLLETIKLAESLVSKDKTIFEFRLGNMKYILSYSCLNTPNKTVRIKYVDGTYQRGSTGKVGINIVGSQTFNEEGWKLYINIISAYVNKLA